MEKEEEVVSTRTIRRQTCRLGSWLLSDWLRIRSVGQRCELIPSVRHHTDAPALD